MIARWRYLARTQRYDGSFASIWFREATAGTASVLEALSDCDLLATPMAARAREALLRGQNDDGGWAGLRMQPSTAEETAWAVLALLRCEGDAPARKAAAAGARWLLRHQRDDGGLGAGADRPLLQRDVVCGFVLRGHAAVAGAGPREEPPCLRVVRCP